MSNRLHYQESAAEAKDVIHRLLDADIDAFDPRADLERLIPNRCPGCGGTNISEADDEGLIDCLDCGIWFNPLHPNNSPVREGIDDVDPLNYASTTVNMEEMAKELGFRYEGKSNPGSDGIVKDIWSKQLDDDVQLRVNYADDPTRVNLYLYTAPGGAITFKLIDKLENVPVIQIRKLVQEWGGIEKFAATNALTWPARRRYESLDDEIPDIKGYILQHGRPSRITISYNKTNDESVEHGDYSESGWVDEEGVPMWPDELDREEGKTAVDLAVEFLWKEGATEFSSSDYDSGGWYTSGWEQNYRTGEEVENNYHLEDFTDTQMRAIYDGIQAKIRERQARMDDYLNRQRPPQP